VHSTCYKSSQRSVSLDLLYVSVLTRERKLSPFTHAAESAPVNHLVEYHTVNVSTGFMTKTPYMGFPTDETDQLWEDLYQCK